jgi:hypothetical protein
MRFQHLPDSLGERFEIVCRHLSRPGWYLDSQIAEPREPLLRAIIGLLYTGRALLAHRLLMELWPNRIARERDRWMKDLASRFRKSEFWAELAPRVSPPF